MSVPVTSRDEIGRVSQAFNSMAENLRTAAGERERHSWLKTGQTKLEDRMRGEQEIEILCRNIITFLANQLGWRETYAAIGIAAAVAALLETGAYGDPAYAAMLIRHAKTSRVSSNGVKVSSARQPWKSN